MGSGSAPLSFAWFSCICLNWDGVDRSDRLLEQCSIALVGKYTKFSDSYASVIKALEHSALAISHKLEVKVCAQYGACVKLLGLDASQTGSKQRLSSSVHRLGVSGAKHLAGGAGEVPRGVAEALQLRVSAEPLLLPRGRRHSSRSLADVCPCPASPLSGVLVPGGFGVRGTEGKIHAISWARKQRKPFLGAKVCWGVGAVIANHQ